MAKGRNEVRRPEVEEMTAKYLLGALAGYEDGPSIRQAKDAWLADKYPAVTAFVVSPVDARGEARQTSTLTVYYEDGVCKICLGEREHNLSLWATGDDLMGALAALEERLKAPRVEWRKKTQWKGPRDGRARR